MILNAPLVQVRRLASVLGIVLIFVTSACGSASETGGQSAAIDAAEAALADGPDARTPGPTPEPPFVDQAIRSVALEDVIFDTFDGGAIRLSDASPSTMRRLRDAIQPVYEPVRYQDADGGDWMSESDTIIGYVSGDAAYAYPIKFLNSHELVNDTIDGVPILVSYCPLCGSGVVYDRRLDGVEHVFGNTSALYENDLVMFDHATGSYWFQVGGEAIVGALTGSRLDVLPSSTMPWGDWKRLHPATQVLSRVQSFSTSANHDRDPFSSYKPRVDALRFPFPVSRDKIDERLPASTITVTIAIGGEEKAYAVETIGDAVINDVVAAEPVVVFSKEDGAYGTAFSRSVDGRTLTFMVDDDGQVVDSETGTKWDRFGRAVDGELSGSALDPVPTRRAFWFSIAIASPGIDLWTGPG